MFPFLTWKIHHFVVDREKAGNSATRAEWVFLSSVLKRKYEPVYCLSNT